MSDTSLPTEDQVKDLVSKWYKMLDVHAPMVELLELLSNEKLDMVFPETTLSGYAGFESWYQTVIRLFFDEVHNVKSVELGEPEGEEIVVKVVVRWQASRWNPPADKSERIDLDAFQTWNVQISKQTGKAVITKYVVDRLEYNPGSIEL